MPNLNWTTSGDHLAQPNYLIAEDGQSPYITFTDEDFDYDRLSIFHENIMAWVAGMWLTFETEWFILFFS